MFIKEMQRDFESFDEDFFRVSKRSKSKYDYFENLKMILEIHW